MRTKESESRRRRFFAWGTSPPLSDLEPADNNHPGFNGGLMMKTKSKLIIVATLTFCVVAPLSRAVCTQTCEEVNVPVFADNIFWGSQAGGDRKSTRLNS